MLEPVQYRFDIQVTVLPEFQPDCIVTALAGAFSLQAHGGTYEFV